MRSFAALRTTDGRRRKYRLVVHVAYTYKRVLVNSSAPMPNTIASMGRLSDEAETDPFGNRLQRGVEGHRALFRQAAEEGDGRSRPLRCARDADRGLRTRALADRGGRSRRRHPISHGNP